MIAAAPSLPPDLVEDLRRLKLATIREQAAEVLQMSTEGGLRRDGTLVRTRAGAVYRNRPLAARRLRQSHPPGH